MRLISCMCWSDLHRLTQTGRSVTQNRCGSYVWRSRAEWRFRDTPASPSSTWGRNAKIDKNGWDLLVAQVVLQQRWRICESGFGGRERSTLLVGTFHMYTYMEEQGVGLRREPYYQVKIKLDSNHVKCHQQIMSLTKAALWYWEST